MLPSAAMPFTVGQIIRSMVRWWTSSVTTGAGEYAPIPPVFGLIAVADALVILAGGHRQDVLAVDHHNKASLFAIEELFNHDAVARVAKGVA